MNSTAHSSFWLGQGRTWGQGFAGKGLSLAPEFGHAVTDADPESWMVPVSLCFNSHWQYWGIYAGGMSLPMCTVHPSALHCIPMLLSHQEQGALV